VDVCLSLGVMSFRVRPFCCGTGKGVSVVPNHAQYFFHIVVVVTENNHEICFLLAV